MKKINRTIYEVEATTPERNLQEPTYYALTKKSAIEQARLFEREGSTVVSIEKYTNASFDVPDDFKRSSEEHDYNSVIEDYLKNDGEHFLEQMEDANNPCKSESVDFETKHSKYWREHDRIMHTCYD